MRNADLYESLKKYCKEALNLLNNKFRGRPDLIINIERKVDSETGQIRDVIVSDWRILVSRNKNNLQQLNAYHAAIMSMKQDNTVAMHLRDGVLMYGSVKSIDSEWILQLLLVQFLNEQQSFNFHEDVFDKIYENVEDYFYRDNLEYRCLASVLSAFTMENDKISLGQEFSIIKLSNEEIAKVASEQMSGNFFSKHSIPIYFYALELYISHPKFIDDPSEIPREYQPVYMAKQKFDEVCSALRLFKKGIMGFHHIEVEAMSWLPYYDENRKVYFPVAETSTMGHQYELSNKEIPVFLEFWENYQKLQQEIRPRVGVAIRRFNFVYERKRFDDRLIDCSIGLEALLLTKKDKKKGEAIARRGSVLLGNVPNECERIVLELENAYKQRNNIVHEGKIPETVKIGDETVQFHELVNRTHEHLRSTLKKFPVLCQNKSESQIIQEIEQKAEKVGI